MHNQHTSARRLSDSILLGDVAAPGAAGNVAGRDEERCRHSLATAQAHQREPIRQMRRSLPDALGVFLTMSNDPPRETTVIINAEALAAAKAGRMTGEELIASAIQTALPDAQNVAVDRDSIRLSDPRTDRQVTFRTPGAVRYALVALVHGQPLKSFRFTLGRTESEERNRAAASRGKRWFRRGGD